jgi:hypothetical protein
MTCKGAFPMADGTSQSSSDYKRYDPLFHFFILPVFAITLISAIVHAVRRPGLHSVWLIVIVIAAIFAIFKIRLYALRVQDRVIRLEERLRLATLLDPALRPRIPELGESQLIALRFASDAELPALAARSLNENLSAPEIKKSIQHWQADNWRV